MVPLLSWSLLLLVVPATAASLSAAALSAGSRKQPLLGCVDSPMSTTNLTSYSSAGIPVSTDVKTTSLWPCPFAIARAKKPKTKTPENVTRTSGDREDPLRQGSGPPLRAGVRHHDRRRHRAPWEGRGDGDAQGLRLGSGRCKDGIYFFFLEWLRMISARSFVLLFFESRPCSQPCGIYRVRRIPARRC